MGFVSALSASMAVKAAGALLALGSNIALARLLGAAEYGRYAFGLTCAIFLALLARHGAEGILMRFAPGYAASDRGALRALLRHLVRSTTLGAIGLGLVVAAASIMIEDERVPLVLLAALISLPLALLHIVRVATYCLERPAAGDLPFAVIRPMLLVAGVATAIALGLPRDGRLALTCMAAACLVALGVGIALLKVAAPGIGAHPLRIADRSAWITAALPLLFIGSAQFLSAQTDILMVNLLVGNAASGHYAAATGLANIAILPLVVINTVLGPRISQHYRTGDLARTQRLLATSGAVGSIITIIALTVLVVAGEFALRLYGPDFDQIHPALVLLMLGQTVNALCGSVGLMATVSGNERMTAWISALTAVANIILNLLLIPRYGVIGAASATALTTAGWNLALTILVRRRLRLDTTCCAILRRGN